MFKTETTEGTFYKGELQVPGYALHHYSYAVLLHNKKIKEKMQERNRFKGHCKQSAFISKISYAMASCLYEIDRRGYNECFTSIT